MKAIRTAAAIAAVALAAPLAAQATADAPAQSVQQRFDAAAGKLDANENVAALADFERLEIDLVSRDRPKASNLALVRARKAEALQRLGRVEEARATVAEALEGGGLDAPTLAGERDAARLRLARLEEYAHDHAAANRSYLLLAGETTGELTKVVALNGASRTETFVDPAAALAHADQAIALAEAAAELGKEELSTILGQKGRVLLNAGRYDEAKDVLGRAVSLRGGLGLKVDLGDVALRSDMALALLRLGDRAEARRYLAYTGSGRTEEDLQMPREMPLPACGGVAGLEPDDVAVIQFAILSDGSVAGAQPVLASRNGEMAYELARSVNDWAWTPEAAEEIEPFFRLAMRVEVRCSNQVKRPPVTLELDQALERWMEAKGAALPGPDAAVVPAEQLETQLASSRERYRRLQTLIQLARHPGVPHKPSRAYSAEALSLIRSTGAPPAAIVSLAVSDARLSVRPTSDGRRWNSRAVAALAPLLADPLVADDPRLRATVRLVMADYYRSARSLDHELATLRAVADDPALADRDPLKIGALVMLANVEASAGRLDVAQAAYDRTGLTAQQCALIDGGPTMLRSGASSSDFPREAMRWGFEGWTSVEYDIDAEGKTTNRRIIAAYPPEVFAQASAGIVEDSRYRASYRPEGDLGCGGQAQRIRFMLPR